MTAESHNDAEASNDDDSDASESALDWVDEMMIEGLAAGLSHAAAGASVGLSGKTVQRRLRRSEFAEEVARRRADRVSEAAARLGDALTEAIDTMRAELDAERSGDRLRAASMIVASLIKLREQAERDGALAELRSEIQLLKDHLTNQLETPDDD